MGCLLVEEAAAEVAEEAGEVAEEAEAAVVEGEALVRLLAEELLSLGLARPR
jgi:hypothetical protein